MFIAAVFTFFYGTTINSDVWWHAQNGKEIVKELGFPAAEQFSYAQNAKWNKDGWLFDVFAYSTIHSLGEKNIPYVRLFMALILLSMLYLIIYKRQQGKYISIVLFFALFGVSLVMPYLKFTPWLPVLIFISYFIYVLEYRPNKRHMNIYYSLPVITLLWANIHITALLSVVIMSIYVIYHLLDAKDVPEKRNAYSFKILFFSYAGVIAACLITPTFISGVSVFIESVITGGWHRNFDYKSTGGSVYFGFFYTYVAVMAAAIIYDLKGADVGRKAEFLKDTALSIVFFVMAIKSSIYVPVFLVVSIPVISYYIYLIFRWELVWAKQWTEMDLLRIKNPVYIFMIPLMFVLMMYFINMDKKFVLPRDAVSYILNNRVPANVYHPYSWGGFFGYYTYPDYKVMISGRHAYSGKVANDNDDIYNGREEYEKLIKKYNINTFILNNEATLVEKVSKRGFKVAYFDDSYVVMVNPNETDKYLKDIYPLEKEDFYNIKFNLRAIAEMEVFAEKYPSQKAHLLLARMYKDKEIDDAIDYLEDVAENYPEHNELYYELGKYFYNTEDYDNAVESWSKYKDKAPAFIKLKRDAKKKLRRKERD